MRCKDWKKVTIGDLFCVRNGASIPSKSFHDNSDLANNYEAFKMGHIAVGGGLRTDPKRSYVTRSEKLDKYLLEKDDIVMGMTDMKDRVVILGVPAIIKESNRYLQNQRVASLRKKDKVSFDIQFVYYQMLTPDYLKPLQSRANRGVQVNLTTNHIKDSTIYLPPIETQQKIVRILSALDQKIELNNQQSKLLETIAFTIYDDFINSINESNSKKVAIGQIADCKLGGTPSRAKTEYWGGSINWINSGAINSFRITGPSELITEEGFKHTSTYMLPKGTTVLAITGATLGQVSRMEIEGCANQSVIGIVGNDAISNEYIYLTIVRNIQEIINRQTGGAQQHINKNDIKEFEIILPNQQLMNNFTNKVRPIFEKIAQNEFENKTLSSLRDTILPELMSGEINLEKVEV